MSPRKHFETLRQSLDYALSDKQFATIENAIAAAEVILVPALQERVEENLIEHFKHVARADGSQLIAVERLLRNVNDIDHFLAHHLVRHINACIVQQDDSAMRDLVEAGYDLDTPDNSGLSSLAILVTNANLMWSVGAPFRQPLCEEVEWLLGHGARATKALIDLAEIPVMKAALTADLLQQQASQAITPSRIRRGGIQ